MCVSGLWVQRNRSMVVVFTVESSPVPVKTEPLSPEHHNRYVIIQLVMRLLEHSVRQARAGLSFRKKPEIIHDLTNKICAEFSRVTRDSNCVLKAPKCVLKKIHVCVYGDLKERWVCPRRVLRYIAQQDRRLDAIIVGSFLSYLLPLTKRHGWICCWLGIGLGLGSSGCCWRSLTHLAQSEYIPVKK